MATPGVGAALAVDGAVIQGRVLDQSNGEPLRKVRVSIGDRERATTGEDGGFRIEYLPAGDYTVSVSTIGYRLLRRSVRLEESETLDLVFYLGQEAATVSETVRVSAPLFEEVEKSAVSQLTLNNTELKNLAGVLIDDPLRSVQTLPGVAAGDDFHSYYSVRGGSFGSNGIILDGVLTHNFVHTVQGTQDNTGSVAILNGDLVESMALYSGAFAPKYGDRTASYLDVVTRDGSRDRIHTRVAVSGTNAAVVGEGPTGDDGKGSWVLSARKSYADYLIRQLGKESDLALGFVDAQGKVTRETSERNRVGAGFFWGRTHLTREPASRGVTSLIDAVGQSGIVNLSWTFLPDTRTYIDTRLYLNRETYSNRNQYNDLLGRGGYTELALRSDVSRSFEGIHRLEAGTLLRFIESKIVERRYDYGVQQFLDFENIADQYRQVAAYVQDRLSLPGGRLAGIVGARFEKNRLTGQSVWNPRASLEIRLSPTQKLEAGWGLFSQFPEIQTVVGRNGDPRLRAALSRHYIGSYERLLGDKTRVRIEAFDKEESNLLRSRDNMWRLVGGKVTPPDPNFRYDTALRGASRGVEFILQRRSANRLAGWVSYGYARTRMTDLVTGEEYNGDFDQRHTVNIYGSYRFSESWNFSAKARLGSSFPYPEYFEQHGSDFFLSTQRNDIRLPFYSRIDLRLNKAFYFSRSKLSLYVEVLNVQNRENIRFDQVYSVNSKTRRVSYSKDSLFPILPTAGFTLEF